MKARTMAALLAAVATAQVAHSQVPTAILRARHDVPGSTTGEQVTDIVAVRQGADGAWAALVTTDAAFPDQEVFFGSLDGGAPDVLRRQGSFSSGYRHLYFRESFGVFAGSSVYQSIASLNGVSDSIIFIDDQPTVGLGQSSGVGQTVFGTRFWDVGSTSAGEPWFVGRLEENGSTVGGGLFLGSTPQMIVGMGDQPAPLTGPVTSVDVGFVDVSANGAHSIAVVTHDCGSCPYIETKAVVVDGEVLFVGGDPVPASMGGTGETWSILRQLVINDAGDFAVLGSTFEPFVSSSYLIRNGEFYLREGDPFADGTYLGTRNVHITEAGDLIHISAWTDGGGQDQLGFFHDRELLYRMGDEIDYTGNGRPNEGFVARYLNGTQSGVPRFDVSEDGRILVIVTVERPDGGVRRCLLSIPYEIGERYCDAVPNSTGDAAFMEAFGSPLVAEQELRLRASSLPVGSTGFFIVGDMQIDVLNPGGSAGRLCVGGSIGRFLGPGQVQSADASGRIEIEADLTQLPQSGGVVYVTGGQTWNFTAWYRDSVGGSATSNFADALSVAFR